MTAEQQKRIVAVVVTAIVLLAIQIAAVFGIQIVTPAQTPAVVAPQSIGPVQPAQSFKALKVVNDLNVGNDMTIGGDLVASSIITDGAAALTSLTVGTGKLDAQGGAYLSTAYVTDTATLAGYNTLIGKLDAQGGASLSTVSVSDTATLAGYNTLTGKLDAQGGAYLSAANVTGTLGIGGVTFSGVVKAGAYAGYTGTGITHGFSTAPTTCVVSPNGPFTATVTSIGATLFTPTVSSNGGTIYWVCVKN